MLCLIACSILTPFPRIWLLAYCNHNLPDSPCCQRAKSLAVEQPCFSPVPKEHWGYNTGTRLLCVQAAVPKGILQLPGTEQPYLLCWGFALPESTLVFSTSLFERCTYRDPHWATCSEHCKNKCQSAFSAPVLSSSHEFCHWSRECCTSGRRTT